MILLTDKELYNVWNHDGKGFKQHICKAQARKIVEWLEESCTRQHSEGFTRTHKDCKYCMDELKEEIE